MQVLQTALPLEVIGKYIAKNRLLTEKAEDRATTTAHGSIRCAEHVQLVANSAYHGMCGEDTCLEIVHHPASPCLDRLGYNVIQRDL